MALNRLSFQKHFGDHKKVGMRISFILLLTAVQADLTNVPCSISVRGPSLTSWTFTNTNPFAVLTYWKNHGCKLKQEKTVLPGEEKRSMAHLHHSFIATTLDGEIIDAFVLGRTEDKHHWNIGDQRVIEVEAPIDVEIVDPIEPVKPTPQPRPPPTVPTLPSQSKLPENPPEATITVVSDSGPLDTISSPRSWNPDTPEPLVVTPSPSPKEEILQPQVMATTQIKPMNSLVLSESKPGLDTVSDKSNESEIPRSQKPDTQGSSGSEVKEQLSISDDGSDATLIYVVTGAILGLIVIASISALIWRKKKKTQNDLKKAATTCDSPVSFMYSIDSTLDCMHEESEISRFSDYSEQTV
jgi:hypothetical protein